MSLLDDSFSIPAKAYGAEPFSIAEMDAHPDSARIWATIRVIRAEHEGLCDLAYDRGYRDRRDAE